MGDIHSKSIEASCEVSKAIIKGETERYKSLMEHQDVKAQEETKRMTALFTLVGETNHDALDTIKSLNDNVMQLYQSLLNSNDTILKEYQLTLRSLGQNIADQSKNFAEIVKSSAGMEPDVQRMVVSTGQDVVKGIKDTLSQCFKMVTNLAEKHDKRMTDMANTILEKLDMTERVLEKLTENNDLYMQKTLEIMDRHGEFIK